MTLSSRSTWMSLAAGLLTLAFSATAGTAQAVPKIAGPAGAARSAAAKSGPVSVAYVEVNSNSMVNVGKYKLAGSGANVFDIGVVFAANINYDGSSAYLYFNPQVQSVLDNAAT